MLLERKFKKMSLLTNRYLLVSAAKEKTTDISLEATDIRRSVYEKYGFVSSDSEMELP